MELEGRMTYPTLSPGHDRSLREAYRKRRRNRISLFAVLFPLSIYLGHVLAETLGGGAEASWLKLALTVSAAVVVAWAYFTNWTCPKCGKQLEWTWNPGRCRRCKTWFE